jgi:DUF4097 and DUF4098 domain-containing protein YvlB
VVIDVHRKISKRGRSAACAGAVIGMIVLLTSGAALGAVDLVEDSTMTVPVRGEKVVTITNSRGDIHVVAQRGRSDILIEYRKTAKAKDNAELERQFAMLKLVVTRDAGGIKISARYPEDTNRERSIIGYIMQRYPSLDLEITVTLPPGLDVAAITSSGDIDLTGVGGSAEATSASGDVEVSALGGGLKAATASGDLTVSGVGGDASMTTASGDISAQEIKRNAIVQTASGDVELTSVGGDLTAASVSGDVTVEGAARVVFSGTSGSAKFTGVRGGVTAAVTSGDVTVEAQPGSPANYEIRTSSGEIVLHFVKSLPGGFILKARTTSGEISVDLPIEVSKVGRHELTGVVRDGKSLVVVETASGDVTVTEAEE